jgi:hypothetical protein
MSKDYKDSDTYKKFQELISKLKPIQCMAFKCQHAYPDEYNWPQCEQNLRGYILSWAERDDTVICPFYKKGI